MSETAAPALRVRDVQVRPVDVPLARPIRTSAGTIESAPLLLIDLGTEEGIVGHSYLFAYTPLALLPLARLVANLEAMVAGQALEPLALTSMLEARFRLLGMQGLVTMAVAGLDMAAWDALAQAQGLPLIRLLGGTPRPIPAYTSLSMSSPHQAAAEAAEALTEGFRAIKIKIGYHNVRDDRAVIRAIRDVIGADMPLMVDYNQALSPAVAVARARELQEEGLYWIEEPTRADDDAGHARIRRESPTPIQLGENWWGPHDMTRSIEAGASDYVMVDVMKIGGVTGWLRAAALAESRGLPLSSHIFGEVSAHLLAATPTAHWLEYLDKAGPILEEPLTLQEGVVRPSPGPGSGLRWREDAVQRFLVR